MGIDLNRSQYQFTAKEYAEMEVNRARGVIVLDGHELPGRRFRDTDYVVMVMESMFSQAQFGIDPRACAIAALREAARTDFWYEREKDYGTPDDCDEAAGEPDDEDDDAGC